MTSPTNSSVSARRISARRIGAALLVCLLLVVAPGAVVASAAAVARAAAVAAPDRHGAEVAERILLEGGNAVDAAIATAFVLAVTFPEAGNLGGGGFMTVHLDGQQQFLDFRETAPAGATRDMYLDAAGKAIPDASLIGALAAGVPGTVAGLWAAHQRYGTLPWKRLVTPAIRLAREGFAVEPQLAGLLAEQRTELAGRTNFDRYFGGLKAGDTLRQPELAATLERIARAGPKGFYRGRTARLIVAEMRRGGGLITQADLVAYTPVWREPLRFDWRGRQVITAPPPSSGGLALAQLLGMKERLAPAFAGQSLNGTRYVHLVAEISKRVFADRAEYLGDPAFVEVPVARLMAPDYLDRRAAEVSPERPSATPAVRPGLAERPQTTHFSILDAQGNAVALTYTLNGGFGSGVVVTGAGFLLNNEMDDFSVRPGQPNLYGVVGGRANEIAPGKRMLSSMTPTIVLEDGRVRTIVGTPGGSTIITAVFQTLVNLRDFGLPPLTAISASRFHHQLLPPDRIIYSRCCALEAQTVEELRALGYTVEPSSWEFGDMQVVTVDDDGGIEAASDPRGRGMSRVFPEP